MVRQAHQPICLMVKSHPVAGRSQAASIGGSIIKPE